MSLNRKKFKQKYNRAGCKSVARKAHEEHDLDITYGDDDYLFDDYNWCDCKYCSPVCGIDMKTYVWGKMLDIMTRLGFKKAREIEEDLW